MGTVYKELKAKVKYVQTEMQALNTLRWFG